MHLDTILGLITERETVARRSADQVRAQIAELAGELARAKLKRLVSGNILTGSVPGIFAPAPKGPDLRDRPLSTRPGNRVSASTERRGLLHLAMEHMADLI